MPKYEFVIQNDISSRPSAALRSHAVKNGLRRKTLDSEENESRDSEHAKQQQHNLRSRFRVSGTVKRKNRNRHASQHITPLTTPSVHTTNTQICSVKDARGSRKVAEYIVTFTPTSVLIKAPSQTAVDPFGTIYLKRTRDMNNLIKYFISRFGIDLSSSEVQKECWGFAMIDPLVLHTSLAVSAATWGVLLPDPSRVYQEGWKQKSMAIREMQERLSRRDCSNAVVGAVANLAQLEGLVGEFNTAQVHLQGLLLLIKERGGPTAFRDDVHMGRAINWADLLVAAASGTRPLIPLIHSLDTLNLPASLVDAAEQPSLSHLSSFEPTPESTEVTFAFSVLRQAHNALESKQLAQVGLRNLINAADYHVSTSIADLNHSDPSRILLMAAQAFLYIPVRETYAACFVPRLIVGRLRLELQDHLDELISRRDYWHGLLWCIAVGSAASFASGENWEFFSMKLRDVCQMLDIRDKEELETILKQFLWDEVFIGGFLDKYEHSLFAGRAGADVESYNRYLY